ncbi:hypothetical protein AV530_019170 [Patagioenas fasciata monilis]|uniref:Uncharacterized protein n=1 Tax=Patagioenas fasciata monilis TaxID=372326 RepID=A0A1V4KXP8_PATFA|nr:hypothetical protein AV530_019170 [Patagioenas fasciata monilis]
MKSSWVSITDPERSALSGAPWDLVCCSAPAGAACKGLRASVLELGGVDKDNHHFVFQEPNTPGLPICCSREAGIKEDAGFGAGEAAGPHRCPWVVPCCCSCCGRPGCL